MVDTLQPTALGLTIMWPTLATVVVALRVYTRISMRQFFLGEFRGTLCPSDTMSDNNTPR